MIIDKTTSRYFFFFRGEREEIKRFKKEIHQPFYKNNPKSPSFLELIKKMGMDEVFRIIDGGKNLIIIFHEGFEKRTSSPVPKINNLFHKRWGETISINLIYGYETELVIKSLKKKSKKTEHGQHKGLSSYLGNQLLIPFPPTTNKTLQSATNPS